MIFTWRGLLRALRQGALRETPVTEALGRARLALDCTAAVVKVGILLFLKMLLLPLLLGACLDSRRESGHPALPQDAPPAPPAGGLPGQPS